MYSTPCGSINQDAYTDASNQGEHEVNFERGNDSCIENDDLMTGECEGYQYEREFWEPADKESELKMQVEMITELPAISSEALK